MRWILALAMAVALGPAWPAGSVAQQADPAQSTATVLRILDQERLLTESRLGQSMLAELREAELALDRDNQALAAELADEERALTELRASLGPDEFRARADEFDRRVELIRAERERLSRELTVRFETEAQRFFQIALPVISSFMTEQGIAAILPPEAVILGAEWLDITDQVISRLDQATAP